MLRNASFSTKYFEYSFILPSPQHNWHWECVQSLVPYFLGQIISANAIFRGKIEKITDNKKINSHGQNECSSFTQCSAFPYNLILYGIPLGHIPRKCPLGCASLIGMGDVLWIIGGHCHTCISFAIHSRPLCVEQWLTNLSFILF